jgi:FixJ family two-component response regulator
VERGSSADDVKPRHVTAPAKDRSTILLVEDESTLREAIAEFLDSGGYRVIAAESEEDALGRAAEHADAIDLLLTDVVLKGRSGKQLADNLISRGGRSKVIYMSGYAPTAIVQHGVLEPGTPFLQKPFSRFTLLDKVEEVLSYGS